jgi:FHA domain
MQGGGTFRLIVRRGPQPNQIYELTKDVITMGRDITNDIVINDPEASRHHCRLTRGGGGYTIEDLTSTNGTFINGQRLIGARPLSSGDQVGLGETVVLSYEAGFALSPTPELGRAAEPASPYPPQPAQPNQPQGTYAPSGGTYGQQQPFGQAGGGYGNQQPGGYTPPPPPSYGAQQPQPGNYQQPYPGYYEAPPGSNNTRWFFIGCGCLIMTCVVLAVVAAFIIETQNLYCTIPGLRQLVSLINPCP